MTSKSNKFNDHDAIAHKFETFVHKSEYKKQALASPTLPKRPSSAKSERQKSAPKSLSRDFDAEHKLRKEKALATTASHDSSKEEEIQDTKEVTEIRKEDIYADLVDKTLEKISEEAENTVLNFNNKLTKKGLQSRNKVFKETVKEYIMEMLYSIDNFYATQTQAHMSSVKKNIKYLKANVKALKQENDKLARQNTELQLKIKSDEQTEQIMAMVNETHKALVQANEALLTELNSYQKMQKGYPPSYPSNNIAPASIPTTNEMKYSSHPSITSSPARVGTSYGNYTNSPGQFSSIVASRDSAVTFTTNSATSTPREQQKYDHLVGNFTSHSANIQPPSSV